MKTRKKAVNQSIATINNNHLSSESKQHPSSNHSKDANNTSGPSPTTDSHQPGASATTSEEDHSSQGEKPANDNPAQTSTTNPKQAPSDQAQPANGDGAKQVKICANAGCGKEVSDARYKYCSPKCHSAAHPTSTQRAEAEAQGYCKMLLGHIARKKGRFLVDEQGEYSVLIDGHRIPLNLEPDNYAFNRLLLEVCNITAASKFIPGSILFRLIDAARRQVSKLKLRRFSAMSDNGERLYVPLKDSTKLLMVSDEIKQVANGENPDCLWIEHPEGEALIYEPVDPKAGLDDFERLIVNNQACRTPEMRWFIAMQEVLFPFVRDLFSGRLITVHTGPAGSGKTTGAEFISRLHGLGDVKGDWSVPALNREGDIGSLIMDNREQVNMWQSYIDFLLFLATGATRGRCRDGGVGKGNVHRPIGVITSIEGAYKVELQDRCVEVEYNAHERKRSEFRQDDIRREIMKNRQRMLASLMPVLQHFLKLRQEPASVPESLSRFAGNFRAVCNLLRAYAVVAEKSAGWSEGIIEKWSETITMQSHEASGGELEYFIMRFLRANGDDDMTKLLGATDPFIVSCTKATYKQQTGVLTVTTCDQLLDWLQTQDRHNKSIPRDSGGLGRRLRSTRSRAFKVLDEKNAPELPQLKRKNSQRFIGLFEPHGEEELAKQAAAKAAQAKAATDRAEKVAAEEAQCAKDAPYIAEWTAEVKKHLLTLKPSDVINSESLAKATGTPIRWTQSLVRAGSQGLNGLLDPATNVVFSPTGRKGEFRVTPSSK